MNLCLLSGVVEIWNFCMVATLWLAVDMSVCCAVLLCNRLGDNHPGIQVPTCFHTCALICISQVQGHWTVMVLTKRYFQKQIVKCMEIRPESGKKCDVASRSFGKFTLSPILVPPCSATCAFKLLLFHQLSYFCPTFSKLSVILLAYFFCDCELGALLVNQI